MASPEAHTPTPWAVADINLPEDYYLEYFIAGADGVMIGTSYSDGKARNQKAAKANAAFIVRACNNHDALVSALRFILAFYEPGQRHLDTEAWKVAEAQARSALKSAEKEPTP